MPVVFTCVPQAGHIMPLLPLAEAFAARGDEVVLASGADAQPVAREHGLGFRQVGPDFAGWYAGLLARTRGRPGDGLPIDRVEAYFLPRLFGEVGLDLMVDGLVSLCRETAPDLLVFDSLLLAGPLAALATDTPPVHHSIGVLPEPEVLQLAADAVSPAWREFGLEPRRDAGLYAGTTLAVAPASLDPQAGVVPGLQPLRPVPLPLRAADPPVPLPDGGRPVVYLTLGTFSNSPVQFRLVLDALADAEVAVVATIGRDLEPASLGELPRNAIVERFIPQADLLPHCDAVVHHAGAGTTFGILAHGLPSVALPQSADNFRIGSRLAESGAARTLMPAEVTGEAVRAAVEEVLSDPAYRQRAQALAAELAQMPSPEKVAASLRGR